MRPVGSVEGDTPEAVIARIEDKLDNAISRAHRSNGTAFPKRRNPLARGSRRSSTGGLGVETVIDAAVAGTHDAHGPSKVSGRKKTHMIRILSSYSSSFAWLRLCLARGSSGGIVADLAGQLIEMSLMRAASILSRSFAAVLIVVWLLRTIWMSPQHRHALLSRPQAATAANQALSTGLIAAGAGDANLARKMAAHAKPHQLGSGAAIPSARSADRG